MANLNYRKSTSRLVTITVPLLIMARSIISVPAMAIVVPSTGTGYNINSFNEQHQIHYHNNTHYPTQRAPTGTATQALEPIQLVCKIQFSKSEIKIITMISSTNDNSKSTVSHAWTQRGYNCHKPNGTFFINYYYNYACSPKNAKLKLVTGKILFYCCVLVDERHLDSPHYYDKHDHFRFNSNCKSGKSFGDLMDINGNGRRQSQPPVTVEPPVITVPIYTDSKPKTATGLNETSIEISTTNQENKKEKLATTKATEAKQPEIKKPNHTESIRAGISTVTVNVTSVMEHSNSTNTSTSDGENSIGIDEPKEPKATSVITVFPFNNYKGPSMSVKIYKDCKTLTLDWQRRISSINTHGTCVEVCQYSNCDGLCFILAPGILGQKRLRDVNFDKRIVSMRACSAG